MPDPMIDPLEEWATREGLDDPVQVVDAACARALGFDLVDVRRLERILLLALEHEGIPAAPADARVLPLGRFARPASAFDHRHATGDRVPAAPEAGREAER